jgi:hypothetical protein
MVLTSLRKTETLGNKELGEIKVKFCTRQFTSAQAP